MAEPLIRRAFTRAWLAWSNPRRRRRSGRRWHLHLWLLCLFLLRTPTLLLSRGRIGGCRIHLFDGQRRRLYCSWRDCVAVRISSLCCRNSRRLLLLSQKAGVRRPAARAREHYHVQPSAVIADGPGSWLCALCHAVPWTTAVEIRKGLRIHSRVYWDVDQASELSAPNAAPISPEPLTTSTLLCRLGRPREWNAVLPCFSVALRRPSTLLSLFLLRRL